MVSRTVSVDVPRAIMDRGSILETFMKAAVTYIESRECDLADKIDNEHEIIDAAKQEIADLLKLQELLQR